MSGRKKKLNQEMIDTILDELANGGISIYYVAKKYDVCHTTILYHIKKRKEIDYSYMVKKPEKKEKPRKPKIVKLGSNKKKIIKPQAKKYKDYLQDENEKRKQKSWYQFKILKKRKQVGIISL